MAKGVQVKHISDEAALDACRAWSADHSLPGAFDQLSQRYPAKVVLRKLKPKPAA
jgi:hypothetical protein